MYPGANVGFLFCSKRAGRSLGVGLALTLLAASQLASAQWVARGWAGPEPTTQSTNVHAADGVPRAEYAQIDSIMKQFMQRVNAPNAQLAVAYQGKVIYSRAYQHTYDLASNPSGRQLQTAIGASAPPTACTPPDCYDEPAYAPSYVDTRFRIASLSKFLTGLAISQLILDGQLQADLSDTAYSILRSDAGSTAYNGAPSDARMLNVTVKHLLQHEWGFDRSCILLPTPCASPTWGHPVGQAQHIADYNDTTSGSVIPWPYPYNSANPDPNTVYKRSCRDLLEIDLPNRKLHFTPGSPPPIPNTTSYYQYYNNVGYCWLSRIIEIKSGMSYEAYVRQKVMNPAGVDWPRIGMADVRDRVDFGGTTADEINSYYDQPISLDAGARMYSYWCAVFTRTPYTPFSNNCQLPRPIGRLVAETAGAGAWVMSAQEYLRILLSSRERVRAPHLLDFPAASASGSDWIIKPNSQTGAQSSFTYTPAPSDGYHFGIYSFQGTSPAGWGFNHLGSFPGTRALFQSDRRGWTVVLLMNTNPEWGVSSASLNCGTTTLDRIRAWCELRGFTTTTAPVQTTATSLFTQLNTMYNDTTMRTRMENAQDLWANQIALPCRTDVDASGSRVAPSDGMMLLRAMFGLRGTAITSGNGVSTANQTHDRTDRSARDYVGTGILDIDGDGVVSADRDGVILLRAMLGFTGSSVTDGVNQAGATRTTWNTGAANQQIKTYLNASCAAAL